MTQLQFPAHTCPVCALRYNFFKGCPKAKTCTIILRGGAEQFTEETERSLHDAIMIVRRAIKVSGRVRGVREPPYLIDSTLYYCTLYLRDMKM